MIYVFESQLQDEGSKEVNYFKVLLQEWKGIVNSWFNKKPLYIYIESYYNTESRHENSRNFSPMKDLD